MDNFPLWAWWLAAFGVVIGLWLRARKQVPQGFECVVERSGKYDRTLTAGSHIVWPLLERAGPLVDIREKQLKVRKIGFVSRDEIEVEVALSCYLQVIDTAKSSYEVKDVQAAVENQVVTHVANHLAACPLGQLLTDRERALRELPERLDRATDPWGVKVTRLQLEDVRPTEALLQAILEEKRVEHEQRALLVAEQGERAVAMERASKEQEAQLAAHEQALAIAQANERAAEQAHAAALRAAQLAAEEAREAQQRQAEAQRLAADAALQAEREQREREIAAARLRSEAARAEAELARTERDLAAAVAWQETLDRLQREREEAAQHQRRSEQETAHAAELARLQGRAELDAVAQRAALLEQEADAAHRASLAAAARATELEQQRLAADAEIARLARQAQLDAIDNERVVELARIATERERDEAVAAAKLRIAELAHAEAREYAAAREAQARADANAVRSLTEALRGVDAATLGYLGAREQADAMRSLAGNATVTPAAAAAALLGPARGAGFSLAQGRDDGSSAAPPERG